MGHTKKSSLHSTPKKKAKVSLPIFDNYSGSDDDTSEDNDTPTDPKSTSNKSSTKEINLQTKRNLITLDASFASDVTDANGPNGASEVKLKTTGHTKQDVMQYFTKQLNGEFKCNLCVHSSKVIGFLSFLNRRIVFGHRIFLLVLCITLFDINEFSLIKLFLLFCF